MLNIFKKGENQEEVNKTWTIILLQTSEDWYVDYINSRLLNQIKNSNLEKYINISILEHIEEIEEHLNEYGDYISVIENIEISDNYVSVIYKEIIKCKKDTIGFSGILKKDDEAYVFNQIEETQEEMFHPICKMNPIKKDIIMNNFKKYLKNKLKKLSSVFLSDVLVFRDVEDVCEYDDEPIVEIKQEPKEPVSIILTAYKTKDFIEECLNSIEAQTYFKNNNDFEVLVGVDGCEETLEKLNEIKDKYRNLSIYMMKENCGTYMTTNALLDLVKYENVIRFDTDDIMEPIMIDEIVKFKSEDDDVIKLGFSDWVDGNVSDYHSANDGIIYFKKRVMDEIAGGYQPWLCAADSELLARLKDSVNIKELNERLFLRRIHNNNLTKRKDTGFGSILRRNYQRQIKDHYNENEVKIKRICNEIKETILNNICNCNLIDEIPRKYSNKKDYVFNQYFGIGDILFIEPIIRKYFQEGHKVILPISNKFIDIKHSFPYITFIDKDLYNIDYEEQGIVEDETRIILPMRWSREFYNSSIIDTMRNKYKMVGLNLDEWRKLVWLRHRYKEDALSKLLGIEKGEKFNLINQNFHSFNNGIRKINISNKYKNIEMRFIKGYTLLDWASIIESASTIHTVNTSVMFLLETLNLSTDDINIYSRNVNGYDFEQTEYLFKKKYIRHI
jgi:glycosyltransferase involved in cell wall biosynthesis